MTAPFLVFQINFLAIQGHLQYVLYQAPPVFRQLYSSIFGEQVTGGGVGVGVGRWSGVHLISSLLGSISLQSRTDADTQPCSPFSLLPKSHNGSSSSDLANTSKVSPSRRDAVTAEISPRSTANKGIHIRRTHIGVGDLGFGQELVIPAEIDIHHILTWVHCHCSHCW